MLQQLFPRYAHYAKAVSNAERHNCNLSRCMETESKHSGCCLRPYRNAMVLFSFTFCRHYVNNKVGLYSTITKGDVELRRVKL